MIDLKFLSVLGPGFHRNPFSQSHLDTTLQDGKAAIDFNRTDPFVAYHPTFSAVTGPNPSIQTLCRKDYPFAHEAGVYDPSSDSVWVTSNLLDPARPGTTTRLHRIHLGTGETTLVDTPSIAAANGACAYDDGILLCDQGSMSEPSQIVWLDTKSGTTRSKLNNYHGRQFNSLNDIITLSSRGGASHTTVWFTDPPYGHEQSFRPEPQLPPHVYMWHPDSGEVRVVADGLAHPNGIAFSPDRTTCYITDTSHIHGSGRLDSRLQSTM